MFQREGKTAYNPRLANIYKLTQALGNPQDRFITIHVAGTNGKGSVSSMLSSILISAGYRTGLYTSPHMKSLNERVRVNGKTIQEDKVAEFVRNNRELIESLNPSFFEVSFAMALNQFAKERIDVAVIETGMGGRLDSTNIIDADLAVITSISLDHTDILGKNVEAIAWEKAGIMKPGIPTVIGDTNPKLRAIFQRQAAISGSAIIFPEDFLQLNMIQQSLDGHLFNVNYKDESLFGPVSCPLPGLYQVENMRTVAGAVLVLRQLGLHILDAAVKEGFRGVKELSGLRGRMEILSKEPLVIADIAHNEAGIKYVLDQLEELKIKKRHIVLGMVQDKDRKTLLKMFPQNAQYYFVKPEIPRGVEASVLQAEAKAEGLKGKAYPSVKAGYHDALENAKKEDLVFIGGSTFVVAEIL